MLLGSVVADRPDSIPTTTTTILSSPAGGLALEPDPPPPPGFSHPLPAQAPLQPTSPAVPSALAAMIAGMALLAVRASRISTAEKDIRSSLQDSLFSDVGHGDLADIAQAIQDLDPGEATAVVGRLSDNELAVWLRELDGWNGSFSRLEEAALFDDLAAKLSPSQLFRLIANGKSVELMEAAGRASPTRRRIELALLLWARFDPADRSWGRIVELLESTPLEDTEAALAGTSPVELVGDLFGFHQVEGERTARFRLDAVERFIDIVARLEDPALKAQVFVAVVNRLESSSGSRRVGRPGTEDVLGGLTGLMRGDGTAVIAQLNHAIDPHANVFSRWVQQMIEADRIDELDVLLTEMIGGGDRVAYFSDPGTDPARPYQNAANLGYFVGAYHLAIDAIADDAEDQINLVLTLFSIVTGVVPGPNKSEVRLPVGPLVDLHARAIVDGFRSQATGLKQVLWGLAKPRTQDGLLWNGAGTTQFQDAWEEVVAVR